jgi:quercetin dioxygenase-like cupin family protein
MNRAQPIALAAGDGQTIANPMGGVLTFLATGGQTAGGLTVIDTVVAAGEGPPLHVHRREDEFIYILEGSFRVQLGEEPIEAEPGSFVFIPRGTPHTWRNAGDGEGRFLAGVLPAATGFEQFFHRYAELPAAEKGVEAFARIAAETGAFEVVGPPL